MNAREALEKIAHSSTDFYDVCDFYQDEIDIIAKALDRLDELEAKATGKKVVHLLPHHVVKCPNCSYLMYRDNGSPYCVNCGQKLDWSE